MKILITGNSGYIGSHLTKLLSKLLESGKRKNQIWNAYLKLKHR